MEYKDCSFNKNLDSIIYHFTEQNLNGTENIINNITGKKIYYYKIDINNDIEEIFDKILRQCEKHNILIFIDSVSEPAFITKINYYLNKFNNTKYIFNNITIINYTNNNKNTIYLVKNKNNEVIFKKIVNVFSLKDIITANDKDFFINSINNINLSKKVDTNKDAIYTFVQKGGDIKDIVVRFMDIFSSTDLLKNQWWFQWYFDLPPCANIRLLQSSGTCWLNSAINSLFLIDGIAQILISRYENLSEIEKKGSLIKFENYNKNHNLKNLLNSLIYNLLINKTKANNDDGNFLLYLARQIKCIYENKEINCNNLNYGNGGDSSEALKIIFKYLLKDNDYKFIDIREITYGHYINKYNKIHLIYSQNITNYNKNINDYNIEIKKINKDMLKIDNLKTKINQLKKELEILEKKLTKYNKKINKKKRVDISNYDIENDKKIAKYIENPQIICFTGNFLSNIKKEIKINNKKYKLCSSVISLNDHYICGIICDDIEFIYDSNNIFIKSEWSQGEKGIKNYLNHKNVPKFYKFSKIYSLIYLKK